MQVVQLKLLDVEVKNTDNKRTRCNAPTYYKFDKVKQEIKKWNTIKHIYRYQTLYKIYNKLFMFTYNNQLACLNYYIEDDSTQLAEIENTWDKPLKERVLLHIDLLRRVKNKDTALEHDIKKIDSDIVTLFG